MNILFDQILLPLFSFLSEPWEFIFIQKGILAVIMVGLCCSLIGTHVVLRRLSFIGDGLAHSTFGGLAVGFLLQINAFVAALVTAVLTALGIGAVSRKADISLDTSIGILFSGIFAFGIVIISHDRNYRGDLFDLLLGNVLTVTTQDLLITLATTCVVIACLVMFFKELLYSSFDPAGAAACGIPVAWLDFALLVLLALTITVSMQTVGVVLVSALLVTPAASALQLTNRFSNLMILSGTFGIASGLIGIYLSYYMDVPAGAAIVLVATTIFFICLLASPKRRPVKVTEPLEEPPAQIITGDYHRIG
jgi:manganese/iron transport system permease protein